MDMCVPESDVDFVITFPALVVNEAKRSADTADRQAATINEVCIQAQFLSHYLGGNLFIALDPANRELCHW